MSRVREQLNLFYIALAFLTRVPVPENVDYSQNKLNQASRYFPLVGWLIGFVTAVAYWITAQILPQQIAVIISMLAGILLTGCFHEDGLADTCDGLGGGWTKEQKLSIMKDSRIGTYGATALWFALSIKFFALSNLDNIVIALIVAHPLSRAVSTVLIFLLPYVTSSDNAKVKPLAETHSKSDLQFSLVIGASSLLLVPTSIIWIVGVLLLSVFVIRIFLRKQIQGFTGDTLGASQQVSELLIYFVLLARQ
ncbi:adenosylcobinamide-GDP ribazoletransferase [Aliikangiella coralliicola]|uniref:Adenosylcobinamide-GDP ribazoletransferase n=1 Tax=Aliikangiella coralliicola TaxID=2592383 RepID=A0A545UJI5_9GAMM|nr:adenosylcobinamide-GDP ribazoletransferase [Aliikangiella coralliicola]TQV89619.1 adenosylcobinamide-GDP ribazoletransferase [Aliikangiella coralliicola]